MQQQHLDQRPSPGAVTVPRAGSRPERLVGAGEHSRRAGLGEYGRAGQRAGLADQDFQVVIQLQALVPGRDQPRMGRGQLRAVEDASSFADSITLTRAPISRAGTETGICRR